ncbi:TPA: NHLP bacteriocin export ABC transporter permease/ATPase subunit [Legionella pneumophila]|nr:NHLP bacteriocin export ABC transporter permease/ATPase subunit [Legionella pneumophila]
MNNHNRIPESALDLITSTLQEPANPFDQNMTPNAALWHCMKLVAKKLKIEINKPSNHIIAQTIHEQLNYLCEHSALNMRSVELTGVWWKKDIGPVIAFFESFDHPAAIIPQSFDRYLLVVPSKNIKKILTPALAKQLKSDAIMFYRTLPEYPLKLRDLAKFSFVNLGADSSRLITLQLLIIILGFFVPIATGIIFEHIIPGAAYNLLWQFTIGLMVNVLVMTLFNTLSIISTMRMRFKINSSLQAAIWERLLHLPIYFFRQFNAGDLADRASGIDSMQHMLTSSVILSISTGITSLLSIALMFYYSPTLTVGTIILVIVMAFVALGLNIHQLSYLRHKMKLQGKLTGFVLQCIGSISKIKLTHSAARMFVYWSELFSEKNRMSYLSGKTLMSLTVFNTAFVVLSTIALFIMVFVLDTELSFGNFIAFNALYTQFIVTIVSLVGVTASVLSIGPLYDRIKPIIETQPENQLNGVALETLTGKIDVSNINFRYSINTPVVFKDLSLSVKQGEFVAIVGASGCGKSTLLRLLLGLEQAHSGKIYYSDMDISNLNIKTLRQQIGVVLQDSVLFSGTILENIVGTTFSYELQEIQEILRHLGLEDEINQMPMGLHTIIMEQGKTLSGGQRQRLLLARALMKKPRLLLIDEATSALDNNTQEKIYKYIASLDLTCITIAHRPSTIRYADRIFVIDNGIVVESGSFDELLNKGGAFTSLFQRQIL